MGHTNTKQPEKLAMLILLAVLLLCHAVGNVHCSTIRENSQDLHSLLDFKKGITRDPNGALSTWNTSIHFCRWNAVNCSVTRPLRVTELNLTGQSLAGQISSSLDNLTFLNMLDLSSNSFVGPLPILGSLQHLEQLYLGPNYLQGIIPDALTNCSNLTILDLSENMLTGVIPPSIGDLSKLVGLGLRRNNLIGMIPPALGNITTLNKLYLEANQLSGRIPEEFWKMPNIVSLYLNENNMSGGFPHTLANMSSLTELSLSANKLGNALPSNIGNALPNLQILHLGSNTFVGQIPASLGNASWLEEIDLPLNKLTGQIPSSLGMLSRMTWLNLWSNNLEARDSKGWEFFHALSNCSSLELLSLPDNQLKGVIPNSIGNLPTGLRRLLMGGNKLSGTVPPSIVNLQNLFQLALDYNNLTGTIEEWIGKLIKLQHLNLEGNSFVGAIPPYISNLSQLSYLYLGKNEFTGLMPPSLGNLQHILVLNLSHNNLQGSIPVEFGGLQSLISLDLSSNRFSMEIPETLGQCLHLETIQMDQNVHTGNIPTSFSNLKALTLLNLSQNNLSGTIPIFISDLQLLTKLDLSYNHLQGEIPRTGVFENAISVYLDGNKGLCGGVVDLHFPPCPAVFQKTMRNYSLVRLLIPLFGSMSLIMLIYFICFGRKTSRRPYLLMLSFGKSFPRVSYKDLAQATGNFSKSNLLGSGSYGSVYRGKLTKAKIEVAIKVFDLEMRYADKTFVSECEVLRNIRHRNLLPILTACSTIDNRGNDFKALIYELMPNGNLDTWLHQGRDGVARNHLGLAQRISIAVDISNALAYLHHDCGSPIVHCDVKPTNILLDNDINAYLGDFGIASLILDSRTSPVGHFVAPTSSIIVKGTIGYIAPEYAQTVHASTHGDVYSFGIVLLEMVIGKRPTDAMFENELNIVNFTEMNIPKQILHIIDAHLQEDCKGSTHAKTERENAAYQCLLSLTQLALSCTCLVPRERMNMREVAIKLQTIRTSYFRVTKGRGNFASLE